MSKRLCRRRRQPAYYPLVSVRVPGIVLSTFSHHCSSFLLSPRFLFWSSLPPLLFYSTLPAFVPPCSPALFPLFPLFPLSPSFLRPFSPPSLFSVSNVLRSIPLLTSENISRTTARAPLSLLLVLVGTWVGPAGRRGDRRSHACALVHQAGALFAGLLMVDSPFAKKAHARMQPLTSLFGGMYLGSLGMIVNPVRVGGGCVRERGGRGAVGQDTISVAEQDAIESEHRRNEANHNRVLFVNEHGGMHMKTLCALYVRLCTPCPSNSMPNRPQAFMIWNFGDVLGCVVLLVLIKLLIVAMVMKSFGFSWEASTLAGACMAQVRALEHSLLLLCPKYVRICVLSVRMRHKIIARRGGRRVDEGSRTLLSSVERTLAPCNAAVATLPWARHNNGVHTRLAFDALSSLSLAWSSRFEN